MQNNKNNPTDITKQKPFYILPNGKRVLMENMTKEELEQAGQDLYMKLSSERRRVKTLLKVADEIQEMYKFKCGDVLAVAYADLDEVYKEMTHYVND